MQSQFQFQCSDFKSVLTFFNVRLGSFLTRNGMIISTGQMKNENKRELQTSEISSLEAIYQIIYLEIQKLSNESNDSLKDKLANFISLFETEKNIKRLSSILKWVEDSPLATDAEQIFLDVSRQYKKILSTYTPPTSTDQDNNNRQPDIEALKEALKAQIVGELTTTMSEKMETFQKQIEEKNQQIVVASQRSRELESTNQSLELALRESEAEKLRLKKKADGFDQLLDILPITFIDLPQPLTPEQHNKLTALLAAHPEAIPALSRLALPPTPAASQPNTHIDITETEQAKEQDENKCKIKNTNEDPAMKDCWEKFPDAQLLDDKWKKANPEKYGLHKMRCILSPARLAAVFKIVQFINENGIANQNDHIKGSTFSVKTKEAVGKAKSLLVTLLSLQQWNSSWTDSVEKIINPQLKALENDSSMKPWSECLELIKTFDKYGIETPSFAGEPLLILYQAFAKDKFLPDGLDQLPEVKEIKGVLEAKNAAPTRVSNHDSAYVYRQSK